MKTEIIEYLTYPNTGIHFKVEEMLTSSQVLLSGSECGAGRGVF